MGKSTLHYCRVDEVLWNNNSDEPDMDKIPGLRKKIEPWFASLFQSEHLSILLGSGFTLGICNEIGIMAADMGSDRFEGEMENKIEKCAEKQQRNGTR